MRADGCWPIEGRGSAAARLRQAERAVAAGCLAHPCGGPVGEHVAAVLIARAREAAGGHARKRPSAVVLKADGARATGRLMEPSAGPVREEVRHRFWLLPLAKRFDDTALKVAGASSLPNISALAPLGTYCMRSAPRHVATPPLAGRRDCAQVAAKLPVSSSTTLGLPPPMRRFMAPSATEPTPNGLRRARNGVGGAATAVVPCTLLLFSQHASSTPNTTVSAPPGLGRASSSVAALPAGASTEKTTESRPPGEGRAKSASAGTTSPPRALKSTLSVPPGACRGAAWTSAAAAAAPAPKDELWVVHSAPSAPRLSVEAPPGHGRARAAPPAASASTAESTLPREGRTGASAA
ncbi:unnamed protein product, partial [Prorocentrum cordatum]